VLKNTPINKRAIGDEAEGWAVTTLKKEGYKVLERNYRSPFGELDIIAEEGGCLVFVEVKRRDTESFGDPLEAITAVKRRHIIKSALFYMKAHRCGERRARFDVVGIGIHGVKLVRNAFAIDE
jgi:putative endonuclease